MSLINNIGNTFKSSLQSLEKSLGSIATNALSQASATAISTLKSVAQDVYTDVGNKLGLLSETSTLSSPSAALGSSATTKTLTTGTSETPSLRERSEEYLASANELYGIGGGTEVGGSTGSTSTSSGVADLVKSYLSSDDGFEDYVKSLGVETKDLECLSKEQLVSLKIQHGQNKISELMTLMTNLLKMWHESSSAIINNMR